MSSTGQIVSVLLLYLDVYTVIISEVIKKNYPDSMDQIHRFVLCEFYTMLRLSFLLLSETELLTV